MPRKAIKKTAPKAIKKPAAKTRRPTLPVSKKRIPVMTGLLPDTQKEIFRHVKGFDITVSRWISDLIEGHLGMEALREAKAPKPRKKKQVVVLQPAESEPQQD